MLDQTRSPYVRDLHEYARILVIGRVRHALCIHSFQRERRTGGRLVFWTVSVATSVWYDEALVDRIEERFEVVTKREAAHVVADARARFAAQMRDWRSNATGRFRDE